MRVPSPALRRIIGALAVAAVLPTAASAFPPAPPDADQTGVRLARLTVEPAGTLAGYSRERFGGDWATTANGCDVRERVLIRDGRGIRPGPGCTITTGRWRSVYDGKILTTGRSVDIDHIVPLAESWRSGANTWTAAATPGRQQDRQGDAEGRLSRSRCLRAIGALGPITINRWIPLIQQAGMSCSRSAIRRSTRSASGG